MSSPFTVAVAQIDCVLGDVEANVAKIERMATGADLVIFPECATTGYFVGERALQLAETVPGPTTERLAEVARRNNVHLLVGIIEREREGDRLYDSAVLMSATGGLQACYRKLHLFAAEKALFTPGVQPMVVDSELGRLGLTICYDLMFPEYIRSLVLQGARVILNCTDWITDDWQTRTMGWTGETTSALAAIRALENGVYVAMANRVGTELGWRSLGFSCVASPSGAFLARAGDEETVQTAQVVLDSADLAKWRGIATYLADRRPDVYRPYLG
jgi:predicted amidohydrolase